MAKVSITQSKLDDLALHISAKSGEAMPLTIQGMQDAVDGIETGGGEPTLQAKTNIAPTTSSQTITADNGYDGLSSVQINAISPVRTSSDLTASGATVTAPAGYYASDASKTIDNVQPYVGITGATFYTENNVRKFRFYPFAEVDTSEGDTPGYFPDSTNFSGDTIIYSAVPSNTTITPSTSAQTIGGSEWMMEGAVTVAAMPSGSVSASATKGSVSNHAISVTPTATVGTAGYLAAGSTNGTTVSVSASELVSGTYTVSASGSHDVTNYASASVASGGATASATKGTVNNHSITVTPSVTRTAGWVTAGSANGTAVTVSASELVSGSQTVTTNDTYNVTNLAELVVNVSGGGSGMQVATATATQSTASTSIQFTGLQGEPTSFYVVSAADLATGASPYKVAAVVYDGSDHHAQIVTNTSNAQATYDGSSMSHTYSNGTLTVTSSSHRFQAVQYKLVYTHGGNSANIGTSDVQVGSGATSISFTGLTEEPTCWSLIFKSNFGTSSGYQRVMAVSDDGNATYGVAMDSGASAEAAWTSSYSNGTLTISSTSTSVGGYFHQPGYYQLTYGIGGEVEPPTIEPLNVTQNGTYEESGKAYSPVTVNVSSGGSVQYDTKTATASDYPTSLQFTSMKGQPKFFVVRLNAQVSSSGSTTYYYIVDIASNSTTTHGNCFRIGSTRRVDNITSGYSWSYSGTTLTITSSAASRSASPGAFYSGSYELMYAY